MIILEFKEPPNTGKNLSHDRTKFRFMEICLVLMCRVMPEAPSYTEHKLLDGFLRKKLLVLPTGYQQIPKLSWEKNNKNGEMLTRANIIFFEMPFLSNLFLC
jgi:hypothetical protein